MPLLCFASPKGGVGKTTLAANVGCELARLGMRTLAVDCDPQNGLGLHFGMSLSDGAGWLNALCGPARQSHALHRATRTCSQQLAFVPAGRMAMDEWHRVSGLVVQQPELVRALFAELLADSRLTVIVDMPPGAPPVMAALLAETTLLIAVLLVDAASLGQVPAIESGAVFGSEGSRLQPERIGFVLNQFEVRSRLGRATGPAARAHLGARMLGTVHQDENVREAAAAQRFIADYAPQSKAALDVRALAQRIAHRLATLPAAASARAA